MNVKSCEGQCCAVFPWPTAPDKMRENWENWPAADWDVLRDGNGVDTLMIADMLIPLSHDEARERAALFGINPEFIDKAIAAGSDELYTCRNWNEETRECGVYEARPDMCASYPYEGTCFHCREVGGCSLQDHKWRRKQAEGAGLEPECLTTVTVSNRPSAPQSSPSE